MPLPWVSLAFASATRKSLVHQFLKPRKRGTKERVLLGPRELPNCCGRGFFSFSRETWRNYQFWKEHTKSPTRDGNHNFGLLFYPKENLRIRDDLLQKSFNQR